MMIRKGDSCTAGLHFSRDGPARSRKIFADRGNDVDEDCPYCSLHFYIISSVSRSCPRQFARREPSYHRLFNLAGSLSMSPKPVLMTPVPSLSKGGL